MDDLKKNKNWNMFVEENKLFATKGADEIYFLDDIDEECVNDVYNLIPVPKKFTFKSTIGNTRVILTNDFVPVKNIISKYT